MKYEPTQKVYEQGQPSTMKAQSEILQVDGGYLATSKSTTSKPLGSYDGNDPAAVLKQYGDIQLSAASLTAYEQSIASGTLRSPERSSGGEIAPQATGTIDVNKDGSARL